MYGTLSEPHDYDRHGDLRKLLPARLDRDGDGRFRPDLVVHRRKADGDNLLVVEWKKHASDETLGNLRERLQLLLGSEDNLPAYNYELGVPLTLCRIELGLYLSPREPLIRAECQRGEVADLLA